MRPSLRRPTFSVLFLALLCLCAAAPIVLVSFFRRLSPSRGITAEQKEFIRGTPGIAHNLSHGQSSDHLNLMYREVFDDVKKPKGDVYRTEDDSFDKEERNLSSENFRSSGLRNVAFKKPSRSGDRVAVHTATSSSSVTHGLTTRPVIDEKIRYMEDQVITARAFLHFTQPSSNSHLVKELKLRIKEIERILGQASKDSDLHRSALQKMKVMDTTLFKANKAYPDCSAMASKLRAMSYNTEEQLRAQTNQVSYLIQLASRTFPKGLHCLSMRLTTEYFALSPGKRQLPFSHKFHKPDLYHYAIFSDNILACAVAVNSTIVNSKEQEKLVFHVVTDSLNFPSMAMWFMMNPPGEAAIQVQSMAEFEWLPSNHGPTTRQLRVSDTRYTSPLNHLRFYLPKIFPMLNKILFLDHDVVVQKDLRRLWGVDMGGKVIGAVETCDKNDTSSKRLEMLVNFSDSTISKGYDPKACLWAFGMNVFDLQAWRRERLMGAYDKWLQLGLGRQLWREGSLPLGQLVFYNQTFVLDRHWHLPGFGHDPRLANQDIGRAAVLHYSGLMKPWLEIAVPKYRGYWNKFLDYDLPHLQQCNIHP